MADPGIDDIPKFPPVFVARVVMAIQNFLNWLRLRLMPSQLAVFELGASLWISMCIHAVAKLGVADLLKDGPLTADELAAQLKVHPEALYRVMRLLAGCGVFHQDRQRRFSLTRLGQKLRSDVPGSARAMMQYIGESWQMTPWLDILYTIRTGKSAFDHIYGMPFFDYCVAHPDAAKIFDDAMTSVIQLHGGAIIQAYDFSAVRSLVDVGGGRGVMLSAILKSCPHLQGVLFDLPHVVESAVPQLQAAGVEARCTRVGGNFFESIPAGHDAYLMSHIIHDWDDEHCLQILRTCRQAMPSHSKLLITETIIPPADNSRHQGKLSDIQMLLVLTGKERTEAEFRALLEAADFKINRIIPTAAPQFIIEALPS